jgi:monoamine oxidase
VTRRRRRICEAVDDAALLAQKPHRYWKRMQRLNRRSFLASSAALLAGPAFGRPVPREPPVSHNADVVIIGAGAAGIAAGRQLAAAGKSFIVIEATGRIGGRCLTETTTFGVPYDHGAHWLHMPLVNPVARLAAETGLDIYPAPPGQRARIGRRYARESEMEDFLAGIVRANRAIAEAASGGKDVPCAQALPSDLGDWRSTIDFVLGPHACSKDLAEISALDYSRFSDRDRAAAFCRQGLGTLMARLATQLPVQLATPASAIEWGGRSGIVVTTPKGRIGARAAIVTVSTDVLVTGKIEFSPALPKRHLDAAARLKLGSYDRVALELTDNPLSLRSDELVYEKSKDNRTAALFANVAGTTLCFVDVAGGFGRDLAAEGQTAMVEFAVEWLTRLYGTDIKRTVKRSHATRWDAEPWVLGAVSAAAPGGQPARKILMEPLRNRIWFAGEAAHETAWGTVGGAWESGERAAADLLAKMDKPQPSEPPTRKQRRQPRQRRR